ncbi:MAG TPA: SMI1/KNR4 family protein [Bacteriovoracaceae bacterium]|nr:SMI1/KNR4 family protein [Bacteriovoracaceae bacterium]
MSLEIAYEEDDAADEIDLDHVSSVQEQLGQEFEPDYLDFLGHRNGGRPIRKYFKAGKHKKAVGKFLCIIEDCETSDHGDDDVSVVWSQINERLNEHLIPFASVENSEDFLCFNYENKKDIPEIVLWRGLESTDGNPELIPIATTFRKFVSNLSKV